MYFLFTSNSNKLLITISMTASWYSIAKAQVDGLISRGGVGRALKWHWVYSNSIPMFSMIHHLELPPQLPWFQYYLHTCTCWTLEYRTKNKTRSDGTQFKPLIIYNKWLFNNQVNNYASSQWLLILPINSVWRIGTHKGFYMHAHVSLLVILRCLQ